MAKKSNNDNPYAALERIFHEPGRLAIMSLLVNHTAGLKFSEIKQECDLTDGNLNSHLKVLEEAGALKMLKKFVNAKPQTTALITARGRESFLAYLQALEEVLVKAAKAAGASAGVVDTPLAWGKALKSR